MKTAPEGGRGFENHPVISTWCMRWPQTERESTQHFEDLLAWGFASAIAVVLLACTLVLLGVYNRFAGLDRLWG
jgi:hypothetical protein